MLIWIAFEPVLTPSIHYMVMVVREDLESLNHPIIISQPKIVLDQNLKPLGTFNTYELIDFL